LIITFGSEFYTKERDYFLSFVFNLFDTERQKMACGRNDLI